MQCQPSCIRERVAVSIGIGSFVMQDPGLLDACFGKFVALESTPRQLRIQEGKEGGILGAVDCTVVVGRYLEGFAMANTMALDMPIARRNLV